MRALTRGRGNWRDDGLHRAPATHSPQLPAQSVAAPRQRDHVVGVLEIRPPAVRQAGDPHASAVAEEVVDEEVARSVRSRHTD